MRKYLLALAILIAAAAGASAAVEEGTVVEVTTDTITIQQGGIKTLTYRLSNELLNNTATKNPSFFYGVKIRQVKKGDKVQLEWGYTEGTADELMCFEIRILR